MGGLWFREAADVARRAGLLVLEVPGWQTRSNASGGFEAMKGVVVHHTASGPSADGWPDVNYETFHDAQAPNAMWKIDRRGVVYIMTAGSANTQGLGGPIIGVPLNRGNFQLMGIELSNNGVGEPYPKAQQDACLLLCRALVAEYGARYGWNHGSVISHFEWAPTRKNDPAGPSRWAPGGGRWNMAAFRADVGALSPGDDFMTEQDSKWLIEVFLPLIAVTMRDLLRAPEFRVGGVDDVVVETLGKVNAIIAKLAGVDLDAVRQAVIETIEGMKVDATLDAPTIVVIANAVNDEFSRRTAP